MSPMGAGIPAQFRALKENLTKSPIAYRLANGAFWSLTGGSASRFFALVSSIIIARLIGKEDFGEFGMVQSTMGMFGVFAGFGLGSTATKYVAEHIRSHPVRAGRITNLTILVSLLSGGILTAVCILISPWLATETLNRPGAAVLLQAGALLLFCSTLNSMLLGILAGFEAFRSIARINIIQGIAAPTVALPLVWFFGVEGAIASLTVNAAFGMILCSVALRRIYKDHAIPAVYDRAVWSEWPVLWKFALPAMLSGLLVAPVTWLTNLILAGREGGYGELGLFNAAMQWRAVIAFVPGLIGSVMLPVLSDTHRLADKTYFTRTVSFNLSATWVVCLPLTITVICFGKPLAALFGKEFSASAPVMVMLMAASFLMIVNGTVGTALAGSGRMWSGTVLNLGWAAALITGAYLMIPSMGALGLATAYLLAYLLHTVWTMVYVEMKIAPSSVSSQLKLMLFSAALIGVSMQSSFSGSGTYGGSAAVLVLSVFPAVWFVRHYVRKKTVNSAVGGAL